MQAWIPVVSSSLYFWKIVFSFRADIILKSDGDFISNWKFPDCMHFFGAWARQAVIETIAVVYELTKRTRKKLLCSPIGHNNTKHFWCPIRSRHPLECLEIVRWESVPRGAFAPTWKLSSCPFSRPNWLPLGLRGWSLLVFIQGGYPPCIHVYPGRIKVGRWNERVRAKSCDAVDWDSA